MTARNLSTYRVTLTITQDAARFDHPNVWDWDEMLDAECSPGFHFRVEAVEETENDAANVQAIHDFDNEE